MGTQSLPIAPKGGSLTAASSSPGGEKKAATLSETHTSAITLDSAVLETVAVREAGTAPKSLSPVPTNGGSPHERTVTPSVFFADAMLSRLARWLRAEGIDVLLAPRRGMGVTLFQTVVKEGAGRIVLTQNKRLAARKEAAGCWYVTSGASPYF